MQTLREGAWTFESVMHHFVLIVRERKWERRKDTGHRTDKSQQKTIKWPLTASIQLLCYGTFNSHRQLSENKTKKNNSNTPIQQTRNNGSVQSAHTISSLILAIEDNGKPPAFLRANAAE